MRKIHTALSGLALVAGMVLQTVPAQAQFGMDKKPPANAATPELPKCAKPLGTAAIQEPENRWWTELGLSNPEALLKLFAARSGCLRIVDRNGGLAMRSGERGLADSGELRAGSNMGKGQVKVADFFIIPDIANQDSNSGGNALGAVAGSFIPGGFGALAGSIRTKKLEAQALITLVDARSTEQLYVAEGVARKTDISFGAGGGGWGGSGFGAAAGSGYADTDIGKVITAAYFNAFVDLVHYMQGTTGVPAAAAAPASAPRMASAGALRATAAPTGKVVVNLAAGARVYPTGQRNGVWMEVDDEKGNRGWVSSAMVN